MDDLVTRIGHFSPHRSEKLHRHSDGGTKLHNPRHRSTEGAAALSLFKVLYLQEQRRSGLLNLRRDSREQNPMRGKPERPVAVPAAVKSV